MTPKSNVTKIRNIRPKKTNATRKRKKNNNKIINNNIQPNEIYRGNINNRLFRIKEIKTLDNKSYVIVENMNPKKTESRIMQTSLENFKRILLTKVNNNEK